MGVQRRTLGGRGAEGARRMLYQGEHLWELDNLPPTLVALAFENKDLRLQRGALVLHGG